MKRDAGMQGYKDARIQEYKPLHLCILVSLYHVSRFTLQPKATYVYEGIVNRMQDPALLNYVGRNTFSLRIFPIEPRSERRIDE